MPIVIKKRKAQKPGDTAGFLLWKAHNTWQREIKSILKPFKLTHVQYVLLASLEWLLNDKKSVSQAKLAKFIKTDVMMISVVMRELISRGFVERQPNPKDTRGYLLTLTGLGESLIQDAVASVKSFEDSFFSDVTHPTLHQELSVLAESV
ncbi:MarR family transcriptional regulator [Candidatus Marinamargulisbacteria bacterium SCGC AG-439-L15]|nr:MarR family transcriptional regulator [Candidatus Marinamargulisbacteria bacterium SCGC AG-439-L15]